MQSEPPFWLSVLAMWPEGDRGVVTARRRTARENYYRGPFRAQLAGNEAQKNAKVNASVGQITGVNCVAA
jgi:hypothetical protein